MKKLLIFLLLAVPFLGTAQTLLPIAGATDSTYIYGTFANWLKTNFYVATNQMSTGDGYFLGINSNQNGLELRRNWRHRASGTTLYYLERPKVAIGTDTTTYQLEVFSSGGVAAGIAARGNNNVSFDVWSSASSPNGVFNIYASRGTIASPTALQSGNAVGSLFFRGHDGTSYKQVGGIRVDVTGAVSTNTFSAKLIFPVLRNGFGGMTDRFCIDNRGRVGLNTVSPGYWLDVVGEFSSTTPLAKLQNTTDSIRVFVSNATPEGAITGKPADVCFSKVGGFGRFFVKADNATDATGWVDINTSSLAGSATLDFPSTSASSCSDLTISVTGAVDGDVVSVGVPNSAYIASAMYSAWVSSAGTVTVRYCNTATGSSGDPGSATFKVTVFK